MATIDGRPAQYGITLKQLRDLMETRGREGVNKVNDLGGVQEICKKLYTSPSEGEYTDGIDHGASDSLCRPLAEAQLGDAGR